MKATLWLLPAFLALLSVTNNVSAQQYGNTRMLQDTFLIPQTKRTKPSLSIVNPLDVLRQRIILEMARRQMRENTKQVEINKAYLKNIGKRGPVDNDADYTVLDNFERHLLDTNSYKTPQYDDNPVPPAQFLKLSNFRQHAPDFLLTPNLEQQPHRQLPKIGYVKLSPMDVGGGGGGVPTQHRLMANKVNENLNKITDNEQENGDDNHNNNDNDETIPKGNNGLAGAGNDDDNYQIKYMYSLYKNRYNVNNNGNV